MIIIIIITVIIVTLITIILDANSKEDWSYSTNAFRRVQMGRKRGKRGGEGGRGERDRERLTICFMQGWAPRQQWKEILVAFHVDFLGLSSVNSMSFPHILYFSQLQYIFAYMQMKNRLWPVMSSRPSFCSHIHLFVPPFVRMLVLFGN